MHEKQSLLKNKRFARLLLRNFALWAGVFSVLILCMTFFFRWFTLQSIYTQADEINRLNLERKMSNIQSTIRAKRQSMLRLALSEDVRNYVRQETIFQNNFDMIQTKMRIHNELNHLIAWNNYGGTCLIYNELSGEVITTDASVLPLSTYADTGWRELYEQLKDGMPAQPYPRTMIGAVGIPEQVITLLQQVPILLKESKGVIVLNINTRAFFDELMEGTDYFVISADGHLLGGQSALYHALALPENGVHTKGSRMLSHEGHALMVTADYLDDYDWWVYSLDMLDTYNEKVAYYDSMILLSSGVILLAVLFLSYHLTKRMFVPVRQILYVLQEDEPFMPVESAGNAGKELVYLADTVMRTLNRNKELSSTLEEEIQTLNKLRLQMLQSQVSPHFLYNALASIHWMALEKLPEDDAISEAICSLSELLRERLKNTGLVPFGDELAQVRRYVTLQKLCFADALELTLAVDAAALECAVPAMLVQSLVENAVKHGQNQERGKTLRIHIQARLRDEQLELTVQDDGIGMEAQALAQLQQSLQADPMVPSRHIGLHNISQQLNLLFANRTQMLLSSGMEGGFEVKIVLPMVKIGDLNQT